MKSRQKKDDLRAQQPPADLATAAADTAQTAPRSWLSEVSRYQWLVLAVAWLGWVFDSMDGTLYSLVQKPSMTELMGPGASEATISFYSSAVFSATLTGWALGGVIFGIIADYIG